MRATRKRSDSRRSAERAGPTGRIARGRAIAVATLALLAAALVLPAPAAASVVHVVTVNDVIGPVSAEWIESAIDDAEEAGAECVVLRLDTPGGLDKAMRAIIKRVQTSSVPVVTWVAPSGARAASAGAIIGIASHVLAMAPGTNVGAAHPVNVGGGDMDETMAEKVTNDAVAYARSLAAQRGRNVEWAEKTVRESVSASAADAVELGVADLLAADLPELLAALDGREIETAAGVRVLATANAQVEEREPGVRYRVLSALADPTLAYMLMILGFYGLFFELSHPGAIYPGVVGLICLILGFFALQSLPINYAGLALIVVGGVLLVAEVKVTSYGLLGLGGVACMILGSLMLIDSPAPFLRISRAVIFGTTLTTAAFFLLAATAVVRAQRRRPTTGAEGLVGLRGVAVTRIAGSGQAEVRGESWTVTADEVVEAKAPVEVVRVEGLRLHVRKVT